MTMTRSAAVSRRAIEPGPGPGLRTAAHSCAPAQPPAASGQVAPPPLEPPQTAVSESLRKQVSRLHRRVLLYVF